MRKKDTITLVSAEGFKFVIDRKAAVVSNTLKSMLSSVGGFSFSNGIETEFDIEPDMTPDLIMVANFLHT
ncbi:hypothetical protein GOP47_0004878 [Adiantum capillus-veneris]|uniref:SKP1 component POZ domain-containing protein n=1 Tax=Adiantum capillus-veneris TaxID=13818 RepID=A0A9D4V4I1_ADICA|nr:hypothetical protein GOP47_0004878 [Adiantum capillus-veneris]